MPLEDLEREVHRLMRLPPEELDRQFTNEVNYMAPTPKAKAFMPSTPPRATTSSTSQVFLTPGSDRGAYAQSSQVCARRSQSLFRLHQHLQCLPPPVPMRTQPDVAPMPMWTCYPARIVESSLARQRRRTPRSYACSGAGNVWSPQCQLERDQRISMALDL